MSNPLEMDSRRQLALPSRGNRVHQSMHSLSLCVHCHDKDYKVCTAIVATGRFVAQVCCIPGCSKVHPKVAKQLTMKV